MSQSKRTVRIIFPGSNAPKTIESDATTWGALKKELMSQLSVTFENQKVRDFATNHHLEAAEAVLPTEDINLLVSTDKNKSGMPVTKANYHKAGFSDLRTFCKKMTGFAPNGKQACIDALDKHYGKTSEVAAKPAPAKKAPAKKEAPKAAKADTKTVKVTTSKSKPSSESNLEKRVAAIEKVLGIEGEVDAEYLEFLQAGRNLK